MAELEVSVIYKSTPAKAGLYTMMVLMPLWAIGVPFTLGLFIALLITHTLPFWPALLVMMTLIGIPMLGVVAAAIFEDDQVLVSKEGIAFPLMFLRGLQFRRQRLWTDLLDAQLTTDNNKQFLLLRFKSGGQVRLLANNISKSDMEQFLLGTEVWGVNCKRNPELIGYQNRLQNETRGVDHLSYTQMWEEELSRRFSATSFVPLEPEKKLQDGRFRIVRQLAFGGLSAIYLAQQNDTDLVVIKEAVVPASANEEAKKKASELFDREALFLVRLDHPNIAKVYDHFAEDGRNYLVLEYIRGQDLRQFVKQNGAQSQKLVMEWAKQIAEILDYLHSQSPAILHRDLTPDNLVRREDESIVLIDFGAANEFVGTATGTLVGKQAYIAPEQLRGKANTSSDIYALGGTIFFLLTGKDPEALAASHPSQYKEVSSKVDALVAACTQLEEEDRPKNAGDLVKQISNLCEELGSSATPTAAVGKGDS